MNTDTCGVEVALYGVEYGDIYEPCAKPRGHVGGHDPSWNPYYPELDADAPPSLPTRTRREWAVRLAIYALLIAVALGLVFLTAKGVV